METIKQILIDSLNGFSADQIPLFLFQLLAAGLMGHLLQMALNKKFSEDRFAYGSLYAVAIAILASLVKYSLPFSVLAASLVFLLTRSKESSAVNSLSLFLICCVGLGCGIGSVLLTALGFLILLAVILFIPTKK